MKPGKSRRNISDATLAVFLGFFSPFQNLHTVLHKINNINIIIGSIFHLEHNNKCSTFTTNIESSLITQSTYQFACKQIYILIPG